MVIVPFDPPLQAGAVTEVVTVKAGPAGTVTERLPDWQPLASLTKTV
jgi:hypothetical protein